MNFNDLAYKFQQEMKKKITTDALEQKPSK